MRLFIPALGLATALTAPQATVRIPDSPNPVVIHLGDPLPDQRGFQTLTISTNGHRATYKPHALLNCKTKAPETDLTWTKISGMTLDPSGCFFTGTFGTPSDRHTILVFRNEAGDSSAAPVFIVGFQPGGVAYRVLDQDAFDPIDLISRDDGTALLIGAPTLSQIAYGAGSDGDTRPYATTYDPKAVYVLTPGKAATYSLEESRHYNEQHYAWAGPAASEEKLVVFHYPGRPKPFLASSKEAAELFAKLNGSPKQ